MHNSPIAWIVAAAVVVRVAAGWALGHFAEPVVWEYEQIADSLLAGRGFVYEYLGTPYRAFVLPVYPVFCAAVYAITGHSQTIVLLLQCVAGALSAFQVRSIAFRVCRDERVALWAATLTAFHPGLTFYATRLHPLTLDLLVFLWVLLCWMQLVRDPTRPTTFRAGISSGMAVLARGTIVPFLILAAAWFVRHTALPRGEAVKRLGVVTIIVGIFLAPWLVRNALVFRSFPVYQTTANESFWKGNNPVASGSLSVSDGRTVLEAAPKEFRDRLARLDELGQSRLFRDEARRFIRENPLHALNLAWQKVVAFWWFSEQSGRTYPAAFLRGYRIVYGLVVVLALVGLWTRRRAFLHTEGLLLLGYGISISLIQSLYYVEGRHRWIVESLLMILSAAGGLALWGRFRGVSAQVPASTAERLVARSANR